MRKLINKILFWVGLSLFISVSVSRADSIDKLIQSGRLAEATDSLSKSATADSRDGNSLYFQSLLESSAHRAKQLLEAALKAGVDAKFAEDVYLKLAQLYLLIQDEQNLSRIINEYRSRFESGKYEGQMLRISAVSDERKGQNTSALRQISKYLRESSDSHLAEWGEFDRARVMRSGKQKEKADKLLKKLSRQKGGASVAPSLYLLAQDAIRENRVDDAVFLYNVLREAYPAAIGLEKIVERLGSLEAAGSANNEAERLTGTYYSIKLGVFKEKKNAKKQSGIFGGYKEKTEIKSKNISGKKYHVVYIGRFTNWDKAVRFKEQLESSHDDVYQVVAR